MPSELETMHFDGYDAFREWMRENQDGAGIWVVIAKKGAAVASVSREEALDVALEFGWIDGQARSVDDDTYLQRFTPRRPQSTWSLRNVQAVETMIAEGRMAPRGLAEVERARTDGRWERAYEGPAAAQPHPDFLEALAKNPEAAAFYATLNSQNRYAIYFRVQNAKRDETRAKRITAFVEMLERGEKFYA